MKRFFAMAIVIIFCFLMQSTVFQAISVADIVPNLLLIVVVAAGYMRGRKSGMAAGLACGLLVDFFYSDLIGLCALFYMLIGYLNGICNKIYYRDDFTIPVLLVGFSDFLYNFLYYIFDFLLRGRLSFFYYVKRIMFPELIYTVLVSVILYKLLHSLNSFLEHSENGEE